MNFTMISSMEFFQKYIIKLQIQIKLKLQYQTEQHEMKTIITRTFVTLMVIESVSTLKIQHRINDESEIHTLNVRNCIQELNKVVGNYNGLFVQGQGFLETCQTQNVFQGHRNGVVLSAICYDQSGGKKSASMYFQMLPRPCKN